MHTFLTSITTSIVWTGFTPVSENCRAIHISTIKAGN